MLLLLYYRVLPAATVLLARGLHQAQSRPRLTAQGMRLVVAFERDSVYEPGHGLGLVQCQAYFRLQEIVVRVCWKTGLVELLVLG